jgi:hypothetical protein
MGICHKKKIPKNIYEGAVVVEWREGREEEMWGSHGCQKRKMT